MKFLQTVLATAIFLPATAQHIEFPLDKAPVTIDGVLNESEWQHAETALINVNAGENVQVLYKHDETAMYFAFTGRLESASMLFPEVVTDAANIGGNAWTAGQWWFHVSATNCENDGGYGVFSNCKGTQPDWQAGPAFGPGAPITDTVELRIPFSKTSFDPATMDTMGIAFLVTNTATIFRQFPPSADRNQPGTWAKATFSKIPAGISKAETAVAYNVFPNPVKDKLHLEGLAIGSTITIIDLSGRVFASATTTQGEETISLQQLPAGLYLLQIANGDSKDYYKLYKE